MLTDKYRGTALEARTQALGHEQSDTRCCQRRLRAINWLPLELVSEDEQGTILNSDSIPSISRPHCNCKRTDVAIPVAYKPKTFLELFVVPTSSVNFPVLSSLRSLGGVNGPARQSFWSFAPFERRNAIATRWLNSLAREPYVVLHPSGKRL